MLEWIVRGLRRGTVTTSYPRRPAVPPDGFRGSITTLDPRPFTGAVGLCPTGAIAVRDGRLDVDRGRCILCGLCVEREPERFAFSAVYETAARSRGGLWLGAPPAEESESPSLMAHGRVFRRSIHIRHVDAGSDGSEEWEIAALHNPYYDFQRLGFAFTAAPRHADILLVSGVGTGPMRMPLLRAWEAMPHPKAVVAAGTDACSGGLTAEESGGVDRILPVDVYVPGSPPSPIAILDGLMLAAGIVTRARATR